MYNVLRGLKSFVSTSRNATRQKWGSMQSLQKASKPIRYPSFRDRKPASLQSSRTKKSNTRTNTKHEVILRSELHRMGFRFRKNVSSLPGKPDIVFSKARIVVFCDGDFWHGRDWNVLQEKLARGTNARYWLAKIAANRERDRRVNKELTNRGWKVIRVWEKDILKDVNAVTLEIAALVRITKKD
jgi:DNA mismatch endonuclease (patch repair protein)